MHIIEKGCCLNIEMLSKRQPFVILCYNAVSVGACLPLILYEKCKKRQ